MTRIFYAVYCLFFLVTHGYQYHCMSLSLHFGEVENEAQRGCVYLLSRVHLFVNCHEICFETCLSPWNFPGKNIAVGCYFLLQEIFPIQGSNLCLLRVLHWQAGSLPLCYLASPFPLLSLQVVSGREGCFVHLAQKLNSLPGSTLPPWGLRSLVMAWHRQSLFLISPTLSLSLWKLLSRVWLFATPCTAQSIQFQGQNTGVGSLSLLQGIFPTQGLNPDLPCCRQILYQLESQGKPKNTGEGSLSLLQRIFPTQKLNGGLLHCRWILYQLSYQGNPISPTPGLLVETAHLGVYLGIGVDGKWRLGNMQITAPTDCRFKILLRWVSCVLIISFLI